MRMRLQPKSGRHSSRTLSSGCNSNSKDVFRPPVGAVIAGASVAGAAATRACPIKKEPTWQFQISKVTFKQVGRGTNSSSNSK